MQGYRAQRLGDAQLARRALARRRIRQPGRSGDGPAGWTANRSVENTDVVLWYVFGIHHITRPEDWPIMPADT